MCGLSAITLRRWASRVPMHGHAWTRPAGRFARRAVTTNPWAPYGPASGPLGCSYFPVITARLDVDGTLRHDPHLPVRPDADPLYGYPQTTPSIAQGLAIVTPADAGERAAYTHMSRASRIHTSQCAGNGLATSAFSWWSLTDDGEPVVIRGLSLDDLARVIPTRSTRTRSQCARMTHADAIRRIGRAATTHPAYRRR